MHRISRRPAPEPGHGERAAAGAIAKFLYIPYLPVWSVAVIALDVFVIWALLSPRRGFR